VRQLDSSEGEQDTESVPEWRVQFVLARNSQLERESIDRACVPRMYSTCMFEFVLLVSIFEVAVR
jgi:hypothetical protein